GPRGEGAESVDLADAIGTLDSQRDGVRRMTVDTLVGQVQPQSRAVDQLPERLPLERAERGRIVADVEQPGSHAAALSARRPAAAESRSGRARPGLAGCSADRGRPGRVSAAWRRPRPRQDRRWGGTYRPEEGRLPS